MPTQDAKNQGTKQMKQKHSMQPDGSTKQEGVYEIMKAIIANCNAT